MLGIIKKQRLWKTKSSYNERFKEIYHLVFIDNLKRDCFSSSGEIICCCKDVLVQL
jgi:hypothetical protein